MSELIQLLPVSPPDNAGIPLAGSPSTGDPGRLAEEHEFQSTLQHFDAQSAPRVGDTVSNILGGIDRDTQVMNGSTSERPNPLAAGDPAAVPPPQPAPPSARVDSTDEEIKKLRDLVGQTMKDFEKSTAAQIRLQMIFTTAQTGVRSADNIMKGT
jgi:hypothetical protein